MKIKDSIKKILGVPSRIFRKIFRKKRISSPKKSNVAKASENQVEDKKDKESKPSIFRRILALILNIFRVVLVVVGLYLVLMPIIPEMIYYIKQWTGEIIYEEHEDFSMSGQDDDDDSDDEEKIETNRVIISAVGIDAPVVEGQTDEALNRGAWHRPNTSTPNQGGNTVITGHRFRYLPPNNLTFYHLDKVEEGDKIVVYWDKKKYEYKVTEIFVVDPTRIDIEDNTEEPRLTLYTCTPLWTASKRLVIVAEPVVKERANDEVEQDSGSTEDNQDSEQDSENQNN